MLDKVKEIINDINAKKFQPIYFLMGEEPYYIDRISEYIEDNVLSEEEKGFNQVVLYGRDVSLDDIVGQAKRYPMMAEKQVVIVKEAQDLSRSIEKLESYANNPQPSTVLVINYKYKKIDKRKSLYKALNKKALVFESTKLYENQVADWIRRVMSGDGYSISFKAAQMLVEFLGNDLGKITNELNKLKIVLPPNSEITPEHIEENIGISKDYNNFELIKAIGEREQLKAYKIITYFGDNPKDNPLVVTIALLYNFFRLVLILHGISDKSPRNVASVLKVNPYFANDYITASRNYSMKKVSAIISELRSIDLKGKGVGSRAVSQKDLLKELMVQIFF